ncbi:dTMP kinase [Acidithiobacillus concretivorus]|uniref:Thymidylate kinase n=1 Tax=Acidithiobacillus concretivorus TaxID=3063952 RepID=A0ABS5ZM92_9PROT|nr:dTMP kinase [Acidithiobacillus concretivorus]MBU2737667.1 dTMP kinase [Acidithiobacillus concretivorus]
MTAQKSTITPGMFITLEGIEGAGKSSAIPVLAAFCEAQGFSVERTREPGGGLLGEALRSIFLNPELALDAEAELLLLYAGRRDHWLNRIQPALAAGSIVLCDRYEDSTYAYQSGGRGFSQERIAELARWAGITRAPDLTFWFDVSPELGAARIRARRPDRLEQEQTPFFTRARAVFAQRQATEPQRIIRIDASAPMDQVHAVLEQALAPRLRKHFS